MVRCLFYIMGVVLLVGLSNSSTQAQSAHNHAACGVGLTEGHAIKSRMLDNRRNQVDLLETFERGRGNDSTVWVPIQFHIVNKSDGTGGESIKDIKDNLCRLNDDYRHINVEFYLAGPVRTINQDLLYTNSFDDGMANFFMGLYRVDGVVNVFIGNQIINGQSGGTTLGYYTNGLDIIYCIKSAIRGTGSTLTHELGHFFSLPHTFFGWENSRYGDVMLNTTGRTPSATTAGVPVEKIIRSGGEENCQVAADGFCDTDPNYLFGFFGQLYNNGCDYAATAHDPNGWLFRPDAINPTPSRFVLNEDEPYLGEMWLKNNSTKDRIYPKTLVVIETEYNLVGGSAVQMWQDTIGDTDTTDFFVPANSDDNIVGTGGANVGVDFINTNGHFLDVNVSAPSAPSLTFGPAPAKYTITPSSGNHRVQMDSLRVNNTSATVTVPAGTNIIATDIFYNGSTIVAQSDRTYALPTALAPGEFYKFPAQDLTVDDTQVAGVELNVNTYAPYKDTTGTTSENVMSYYADACAIFFSPEQGDAMKADIASRGFATIYSAPTDITITDTAVLVHPVNQAIAPQPLVNLQWAPVNGATMYHINLYEVGCALPIPIIGGDVHDFVATGTDAWVTLLPNKCYEWRVYPMNATTYCDYGIASPKAFFSVYDWAVGVEQVEAELASSKVYPNPSGKHQDVILEMESNTIGDAQVTIYNSIGQEVMPTQTIALLKGANVQKLNTSSLTAGLYIINIKTQNGMASHKLTIKD